jgi:hypothetical protein
MLFYLPVTTLLAISPTMSFLVNPTDPNLNSGTKNNPLVIPHVNLKEMEIFVDWMHHL